MKSTKTFDGVASCFGSSTHHNHVWKFKKVPHGLKVIPKMRDEKLLNIYISMAIFPFPQIIVYSLKSREISILLLSQVWIIEEFSKLQGDLLI